MFLTAALRQKIHLSHCPNFLGRLSLTGFGTFSVTDRPARQGRNPRTGEAKAIPASEAPKFKAGKKLKDSVNA